MTKKVRLAVFDRDLKAREFGDFELTGDGSKISVRKGGKRNFNPTLDNDSFIELPYRSMFSPWKVSWRRIYFARNGAKSCVRFRKFPNELSNKIKSLADLQEIMAAAEGDNPEAKHQLNELMKVIETASNDDFLVPDPEEVMNAAKAEMIKNFGKEEQQTPIWMYVLIAINLVTLLKVLGVIV